jgi:N-acetylglucosamine-6-sulfatase
MLSSWPPRAFVAFALLFAVSLGIAVPDRPQQDPARERPNILLVLTDDQPADTVAEMSKLREGLVEGGVTFERGFVTDPLCCPSRASILTGKYAHNHGIKTNSFPGGGAEKFQEEGLDGDTIATRLKEAGYSTGTSGSTSTSTGGATCPLDGTAGSRTRAAPPPTGPTT